MIVRDGGATIEETIASVRPHVDQVAVWVDERTRDDTVAVLERLSAQHGTPLTFATGTFEWFAQARNESFDLVDSAHEWIIWLDDDVLVHGENLPGLVAHASPDAQCITVSYDYFDLSDGSAWITKRSRVARRGAVKWEGAIHEDLVPVPARSVLITASVLQHGLSVRHLRRDPRPPGHYLQEIVAATDDLDRTPHAFLYLGKELLEVGRPEEAAAALKQYLAERHDLRTAPEYNWARVEALERFAEAQKQLGDESMAAAFQAQAVTERTAADEHMASLLRDLSKPAINEPKVGRNDPCPCGSGKKYKRCHGA